MQWYKTKSVQVDIACTDEIKKPFLIQKCIKQKPKKIIDFSRLNILICDELKTILYSMLAY